MLKLNEDGSGVIRSYYSREEFNFSADALSKRKEQMKEGILVIFTLNPNNEIVDVYPEIYLHDLL